MIASLALLLVTQAAPMNAKQLQSLKEELIKKHGEAQKSRVERGVDQVASLWQKNDGDLGEFCRAQFISDPGVLDDAFNHFEANLEQADGHALELGRFVREPTDLDLGPVQKADELWATYDPSAHLVEDLFNNKVAFTALLNFPSSTLKQRLDEGPKWSRKDWAEARLTGRFARRVPGEIAAEISKAAAEGSLYIDSYNVWMHHLVDEKGERLWPKGLRLITHWNLRDELKGDYAEGEKGLAKQRAILKVMERIVTQTIPLAVIDNPKLDWNPFSNEVKAAPAAEIEDNAPPGKTDKPDNKPEPSTRYARLWANFAASKKADPFSPASKTAVDRAFELGAELPEARVKEAFEAVLSSPMVPKVAAEIEKKLGRKLLPQDLWYNGFVPRGAISEADLDKKCRERYPNKEAFAKDIPRILEALGFAKDKAKFLSEHIQVDAARGAGHALQAERRGDLPHLRTRVEKDGMNYKGYNIAVHELGHNIEQVFSLYEVDHTLLKGVPNTAFTEALAFVFQGHDLELLGLAKPDAKQEQQRVLNDFWMTYEIAGVALVDIAVWHWMYDHPKATPDQLRDATIKIATEIWNKYYAKVLGGQGTPLLGIYSHMISYPLYLFNYPLGHMIAFQIEEQMTKAGKIGPEFERMTKQGSVGPDLWMVTATGEPVGPGSLLRATEAALSPKN